MSGSGTFYLHLQASDAALNETSVLHIQARIDNTAPIAPTSLTGVAWSNSLTSAPLRSWSSGSDSHSGISHYEYAIGTSVGGTQIRNWQNIGNVASITVTGLTLSNGVTYHPSIRLIDLAGNVSTVRNGASWTVDTTPPGAPSIVQDGMWSNSLTNSPNITFSSGSDAGSGLASHQIRIVRVSDGQEMRGWTTFLTGNSLSGLTLQHNISYRAEVRAVDNAGNTSSISSSDGWTVDTEHPVVPSEFSLGAVPYSLTRSPDLNFNSGSDALSGVSQYQARLIRTSDSQVMKDWATVNSGQKLTGMSLTHNVNYTIQLRVVDNASNIANVSSLNFNTHPSGYFLISPDGSSISPKCSIHNNGKVRCWGTNNQGQLGDGTTTDRLSPTAINSSEEFIALTVGYSYGCALSSQNKVFCWGRNNVGQLGDGTFVDRLSPVAVDPSESYRLIKSNNGNSTCGLTVSDKLKCWGHNTEGLLGDGSMVNQNLPVCIDCAEDYVDFGLGGYHGCALTKSGKIKCWGKNSVGQVGDGTSATKFTPVEIDSATIYVKLNVSNSVNCALTSGKNIKCWGLNYRGAIGDGTTVNKLSPTLIDSATQYDSVLTSTENTCGIRINGQIKCWGSNSHGQVGNGTNHFSAYPNVLSPILIDSSTTYISLSLGSGTTCGLTSSNDLKCWGGLSGTGTINNRTFPVLVDSGIKYSAINAPRTCAITSNSKLKCWGYQVGDGSSSANVRETPVLVPD